MTTTILVATRNRGKQREIREIFTDPRYRVVFPDEVGLPETVEEEHIESEMTFEGNAFRKAQYFGRKSGLPTAGEDSGLEVYALGGAPGVHSRRFAPARGDQDASNNAELLRRLQGAPPERRKARYRSVIVYLERPDGPPHTFEGSCHGAIAEAERGSGGFGYDPLFLSDELGQTFGEAPAEAKHAVSHRGRSLRAFAQWLNARARP